MLSKVEEGLSQGCKPTQTEKFDSLLAYLSVYYKFGQAHPEQTAIPTFIKEFQ